MTTTDSPPVVVDSGPNPDACVIWLHGLGADGHDFEPLVPELQLTRERSIRFVFPHAPVRRVTINNGMSMRAWYDFRSLDLGRCEDETQMEESIGSVLGMIGTEPASGTESQRVILAGFSQGGAIALHAGLRYPDRLAGVIALSTYLPGAERLVEQLSSANRGLPIFLGHGQLDPIIPIAAGRAAAKQLAAWGYQTEVHEYAMPHSVCNQEIHQLREWILERLGKAAG